MTAVEYIGVNSKVDIVQRDTYTCAKKLLGMTWSNFRPVSLPICCPACRWSVLVYEQVISNIIIITKIKVTGGEKCFRSAGSVEVRLISYIHIFILHICSYAIFIYKNKIIWYEHMEIMFKYSLTDVSTRATAQKVLQRALTPYHAWNSYHHTSYKHASDVVQMRIHT